MPIPLRVIKNGRIVRDVYPVDLPSWQSEGWSVYEGADPAILSPEQIQEQSNGADQAETETQAETDAVIETQEEVLEPKTTRSRKS